MTRVKQILTSLREVKKYHDSDIIRDYESRMSVEDIAQKHRMPHKQSVYAILKRHGINPDRSKRTKHNHEDIIKDYVMGMKISEIAKKHGIVNSNNVYSILRRNNVEMNRPRGFERR